MNSRSIGDGWSEMVTWLRKHGAPPEMISALWVEFRAAWRAANPDREGQPLPFELEDFACGPLTPEETIELMHERGCDAGTIAMFEHQLGTRLMH